LRLDRIDRDVLEPTRVENQPLPGSLPRHGAIRTANVTLYDGSQKLLEVSRTITIFP
jgi:hypothetical protein